MKNARTPERQRQKVEIRVPQFAASLEQPTVTKRNRSERKGRRSRDTGLEYSTGGVMTRQAADLKDGGPRYLF